MAIITFDEYCGRAANHMDELCELLRIAEPLIHEKTSNVRERLLECFLDPTQNDCLNIAAVAMSAHPDDTLDPISVSAAYRHDANNRLQFLYNLSFVLPIGPVQQELVRITQRAKELLFS